MKTYLVIIKRSEKDIDRLSIKAKSMLIGQYGVQFLVDNNVIVGFVPFDSILSVIELESTSK